MIAAAFLLLQAASAPPERFSILDDPCPASTEAEVVVCGRQPAPRLPSGAERGPLNGPRRATGDPRAGLENAGNGACVVRGCQVGVDVIGMGVAAVRLVGKIIDPNSCCEAGEATDPAMLARDIFRGGKRALGGKPDRSGRVAIALDAPPPSLSGRLHP